MPLNNLPNCLFTLSIFQSLLTPHQKGKMLYLVLPNNSKKIKWANIFSALQRGQLDINKQMEYA